MRKHWYFSASALVISVLAGLFFCQSAVAEDSEHLDLVQKLWSGGEVAFSLSRAQRKITPEDEYYLGRTVAAQILAQYPPLENATATLYLNRIGTSLALASKRPEVFKGYHFIILDSDEIDAFSSPGAFIFVTRGLLQHVEGEDMLAAAVAHEIAHIQGDHGRQLIKEKLWRGFWTDVATSAAFTLKPKVLGKLTKVMSSMAGAYFKTLYNKGYGKDLELKADQLAVRLLQNVGYDPWALIDLLEGIDKADSPHAHRLTGTHPKARQRIQALKPLLSEPRNRSVVRERRFHEELAVILGE